MVFPTSYDPQTTAVQEGMLRLSFCGSCVALFCSVSVQASSRSSGRRVAKSVLLACRPLIAAFVLTRSGVTTPAACSRCVCSRSSHPLEQRALVLGKRWAARTARAPRPSRRSRLQILGILCLTEIGRRFQSKSSQLFFETALLSSCSLFLPYRMHPTGIFSQKIEFQFQFCAL